MGKPFDELLLRHDEDQEHRNGSHGRSGKLDVPHGPAIGVGELGQSLGQGEHLRRGEEHDGFEIEVP